MRLASIPEAARILELDVQQLRRGVESGRYAYVEIDARRLVDVDELERVIEAERATINIREAAELTGLPVATIRRCVRQGVIPHTMIGNRYAFDPEELIGALEAMKRRN